MNSSEARMEFDNLRIAVFPKSLLVRISTHRLGLIQSRDKTYLKHRMSATRKVSRLVEKMLLVSDLETSRMTLEIAQEPVEILSFLLDRFAYVDEYLRKSPSLEFSEKLRRVDILRWGLIYVWNLSHEIGPRRQPSLRRRSIS